MTEFYSEDTYVITKISRAGGNTEKDEQRIGRRVIPTSITVGGRAILVLADDEEKALLTSRVEDMSENVITNTLVFHTMNTSYKLEKEAV